MHEATASHPSSESDAALHCPECNIAVSALVADDYGNVTASCSGCGAVFDFEDLQCFRPGPTLGAPIASIAPIDGDAAPPSF